MIGVLKQVFSSLRVRKEQRGLSRQLRDLQYRPKIIMVAMRGAPHLAVASAVHVEKSELVIVGNGMFDAECNALSPFCRALVRTNSVLSHNEIIEVLIANLYETFWLLDHDCFVLDSSLLTNDQESEGSFGAFVFQETYLNVCIPQTFLLRLNPGSLRSFSKEFKVGVGVVKWEGLSEEATRAIEQSGIVPGQYPESSKAYFDTFRAIHFAGLSGGLGFSSLRNYSASFDYNNEVIHLGGTSHPIWTEDLNKEPGSDSFWRIRYSIIGAYGWKLLAEVWNEHGGVIHDDFLPSAVDMRAELKRYGYCSDEELEALDAVAERLRSGLFDRRR